MEKILKNLKESGLSEKESLVYYSSLSLGPTTVLKISRKSGLKRATVYSVIDSLIGQNLMSVQEVGLKKLFVSEDPNNLQQVVYRKMESVKSVIPDLKVLHNKSGRETNVRTYEGITSLKNIINRFKEETKRGDYRYFIGGDLGWNDVDSEVQNQYLRWRDKIELDAKLLFQDSARYDLHKKLQNSLKQEVRVLPKKMKLDVDITITPKMLLISKLSPPVSAIVIEEEDIIRTYKELFLYMWESTD